MMTVLEMEETDKWNALMKAIKCYNESVETDNDNDPFDTFYEVMSATEDYESVSFNKVSFVGDKNIVSDDFHPIKSVKLKEGKQTYIFDDIDEYLKANNY